MKAQKSASTKASMKDEGYGMHVGLKEDVRPSLDTIRAKTNTIHETQHRIDTALRTLEDIVSTARHELFGSEPSEGCEGDNDNQAAKVPDGFIPVIDDSLSCSIERSHGHANDLEGLSSRLSKLFSRLGIDVAGKSPQRS